MEGKHAVPLECKRTLGAPQLTSQLPCSYRGDSWIVCLFLGSRHNSHPKYYLSLAIKWNLCYNKSAHQKGRRRQIVTVRTQGSSGTPVISAAEFTFTQGPWLSPKGSEASEWYEAAPLPQKPVWQSLSQPASLNKILVLWQQTSWLPGKVMRCSTCGLYTQKHHKAGGAAPSTDRTLQPPYGDRHKPSLMAFGVCRLLQTYCPGSSSSKPFATKEVVNCHFTKGTLAEYKYSPKSVREWENSQDSMSYFLCYKGQKMTQLKS